MGETLRLTADELAALKDQIKAEVLQEIEVSKWRKSMRNWDKVKEEVILPRIQRYDGYHQSVLVNALSAVIRYSLGIRSIMLLPDDKVDKAKEIATKILDIMFPSETEGK